MRKKNPETKRSSDLRRAGQLHPLVSRSYFNKLSAFFYQNSFKQTGRVKHYYLEAAIAIERIVFSIGNDEFPVVNSFIPGDINVKLPLKSA